MISFIYKRGRDYSRHGQGLERDFLMLLQLDFLIM